MDTVLFGLINAALFVFGVILGSFLNVLVIRKNTGETLLGRSKCMSCLSKLSWYELLPVVSFLWQKGRCRSCKSAISLQYPIVEILMGLLSVLSFYLASSWVEFVLFVGMFFYLLALSVYDFRHLIVPNDFVLAVAALGFFRFVFALANLASYPAGFGVLRAQEYKDSLIITDGFLSSLLVGFLLFVVVYIAWKFPKKELIGLGDGKLLFAISVAFGWKVALFGLYIGILIGAVAGLTLVVVDKLFGVFSKRFTIKAQIPFAPAIVLGVLAELVFELSDLWVAWVL